MIEIQLSYFIKLLYLAMNVETVLRKKINV